MDHVDELAPEQGRSKPAKARRGFWLTSLIIGASLLTWLTMVGTVAAVIYVAVADEDSSLIDDGGQSYKDEDGYKCDYLDTDINDLCPANPNFAD